MNSYVSPCNGKHLIYPRCTTFFTICELCTRSKNKWQPTFFCKCPCKKCFSCSRRSREKNTLSCLKKKRNILIIFHILNLFKHLNPKRAALIFNGSRKYYPNKLNASFIILHGVSHINHQLIKKIPNITP